MVTITITHQQMGCWGKPPRFPQKTTMETCVEITKTSPKTRRFPREKMGRWGHRASDFGESSLRGEDLSAFSSPSWCQDPNNLFFAETWITITWVFLGHQLLVSTVATTLGPNPLIEPRKRGLRKEDHPRTCKWLVTMVIISPLRSNVPLPNRRTSWHINGGDPNYDYESWEPILQGSYHDILSHQLFGMTSYLMNRQRDWKICKTLKGLWAGLFLGWCGLKRTYQHKICGFWRSPNHTPYFWVGDFLFTFNRKLFDSADWDTCPFPWLFISSPWSFYSNPPVNIIIYKSWQEFTN